MNAKQRLSFVGALVAIGFLLTSNAYAATPTLSLSITSGDNVQISISGGDPNSTVTFYYNIGGTGGTVTTSLGTTDSNGSFTKTISTSGYAVNGGASVYIAVGIVNSTTQTWPYGSSSSSSGALTFSQNNISLAAGQNTSVTISGGSGNYSVNNNSNSTAVSTTLSGNAITVRGIVAGSATITVCDQANHCSTLVVTVGSGSSNTSSGSLTFSQANPSIAVGQSVTVNASGGSGYYASGNTNPSVALASVNDSAITISGIGNGSATITICSLTSGCGTITVNVGTSSGSSGTSGTNSAVVFSITSPTVAVGQSVTVTITGNSGYFISNSSNSNVVQASLSTSLLTLTGLTPGTSAVSVCASSGGCSTLNVTVTSATTTVTTPVVTTPVISTTGTSNTSVLAAIQLMQGQLTQLLSVIQTMQTQLAQLVSGFSATASVSSGGGSGGYKFLYLIALNSTGTDVTELQKILLAKGFYSGPVNGSYGASTEAAVKAYQTARGISAVGYVGPSTRAALNAGN